MKFSNKKNKIKTIIIITIIINLETKEDKAEIEIDWSDWALRDK